MVFFSRMKKGLKITLIAIGVAILLLSIVIALLVKNANRVIKHELESHLGKDFSVKQINLHWGSVEALNIGFRNPAGKEIFKTDSLIIEADFIGLLKKQYILSKVSFKNPYIFLEKDTKGEFVNPFLQKTQKKEAEKPMPPVLIKKIEIMDGSIDYLDRKVSSTPVLTRLRNIELEFKEIAFPLGDNFSTYNLSASIPGSQSTGILKSKGKIALKTKDTGCRVEIRRIDITGFKPYFQKKGDVNVTKGTLDMDMDVKIKSKKINAPGKAALRGLEFERGGIGNKFLNIPLSAVVSFLKNNNNEIVVHFILEGDLDNPKFNLRENFMQKISIAIAEKLGLSIKRIGESIVTFGAEGVKEVGKGAQGIGESIKNILKR
jgi:uncharacterized protein involved in outer membrane biogenesis